MREADVEINLNAHVESILTKDGKVLGLMVNGEKISGDSVIIATGGYSYPSTGSDGEGHRMAKKLGHSITA